MNAHHVKNVPGRKTDMSDAQWLADIAAQGVVRPSMVQPPEIRALRELTRYRRTQVQARGVEIQRLEKLLQDAGIGRQPTTRGTRHGSRHLRQALIEAARAVSRTKGTFLSARYSTHHGRRRGDPEPPSPREHLMSGYADPHRRDLHRPRRRLLHQATRPRTTCQPPHQQLETAGHTVSPTPAA